MSAEQAGGRDRRSHERPGPRRGVFIPIEVIALGAIVVTGATVALVAALFPAAALPMSVGTAMTGLLFGMYDNARQRRAQGPGGRGSGDVGPHAPREGRQEDP